MSKNTDRKAHKLIRCGSTTVRIFKIKVAKYRAFEVRWKIGDKVFRKVRSDIGDALEIANQVANALGTGQSLVCALRDEDVAAYKRACVMLEPTGVPLELAVAEYVMEWKRKQASGPRIMAGDAVAAYLKDIHGAVSKTHYCHLRSRLNRFAGAFNIPLADVTAPAVGEWLKQQGEPRSIFNTRSAIVAMINHGKHAGWLPPDWNVMKAVRVGAEMPTIGEVTTYTPEEMQKVLDTCWLTQRDALPFIGLAAFAGVRHEEIMRLTWSDIQKDNIFVGAKQAKTASRRVVPVLGPLLSIIETGRADGRSVAPVANMTKRLMRLFDAAGVTLKRNALRHSWISYRLAIVKNAAQVALEAGNSPTMIFRNYRELVTEESAQKWFNLVINKS